MPALKSLCLLVVSRGVLILIDKIKHPPRNPKMELLASSYAPSDLTQFGSLINEVTQILSFLNCFHFLVFLVSSFLRNSMSKSALSRIQNLADDDLFLNFDADEIPKTEASLKKNG